MFIGRPLRSALPAAAILALGGFAAFADDDAVSAASGEGAPPAEVTTEAVAAPPAGDETLDLAVEPDATVTTDIPETPATLFADGDYEGAAAMAHADGGADNEAMAAKAMIAAAFTTRDLDARARYAKLAREYAEEAVADDPNHVEGRLYLAASLWFEGRRKGPMQNYFSGLPQRGKELLEGVIADAPDGSADKAWARAFMGGWHFEIIRLGGSMGTRMLGADLGEGADNCNEAMDGAPDNPAIAFNCGVLYLAVDADMFAEHAKVSFQRAIAGEPVDAFETELQERAELIYAEMQEGDEAAWKAEVAMLIEG